jgi:hypothetical protein
MEFTLGKNKNICPYVSANERNVVRTDGSTPADLVTKYTFNKVVPSAG